MKAHPKIIDRILGAIAESKTICVVGHVRPDGDCIGSQLAMAMALRNDGKEVCCWNEDIIPQKYAFMDKGKLMQKPRRDQKFDCVIATDCATLDRLGSAVPAERKVFINIDHHKSNTRYGDLNWISGREASTGELIFRLLKIAGWKITPEMADCLFTAVSTDTGSFQYPTTKPLTYHTAADLVKLGANLGTVCNEVYQSYPLTRVRLLKHLYNHFRLAANDQIAYLWLKKADFARTGAERSDTEGLIDHIRCMEPVVVACVFEEVEPELTRVSLRSKSDAIDVSQIASLFGGGGHTAAAGAKIVGRPLSVQRRVIDAIKKALKSIQ
jgi:phosphoesterase RecJ-like protein